MATLYKIWWGQWADLRWLWCWWMPRADWWWGARLPPLKLLPSTYLPGVHPVFLLLKEPPKKFSSESPGDFFAFTLSLLNTTLSQEVLWSLGHFYHCCTRFATFTCSTIFNSFTVFTSFTSSTCWTVPTSYNSLDWIFLRDQCECVVSCGAC